jgi:hypothetical protein
MGIQRNAFRMKKSGGIFLLFHFLHMGGNMGSLQ